MMHVSDLYNGRNTYWRSILRAVGSRQALIPILIRWILGHISLFKKRTKKSYSAYVLYIQYIYCIINLPKSGSNNIKPTLINLLIDLPFLVHFAIFFRNKFGGGQSL